MSQLYVRSALRMVSETVLTQRDVISTTYLGDQASVVVMLHTRTRA